jgi:hypothetical protein
MGADRRLSFLDPDLEVILEARNWLTDPNKRIQGRFEKGSAQMLGWPFTEGRG